MEWNHEKDKNWKDKQLNARKEMAFMEYLRSLKIDLQQRYPEKTVKQDGKSSCVLDEIAEMLQVSLPNEKIMKDIGIYLEEIKKAVYFYGDSLQWMDLEESGAEKDLKKLLYPNIELTDTSFKQDARFANIVWEGNEIEILTQLRAICYQIYE
ncbi:TPA: hypothetical protein LND43_000395 [Enterococcus faecium]|jgi:hypothetical protein|uniref:hypothetical protein n=1 Tax=Bacillota TaxID=1239 RepID=UPI001C1CDA7A|nr:MULTISPECIES: hypothetical protein [Bacillota]HAQ5928981.1 hypothetical protein [Enterococcus faecium]HBG7044786.1 hypothetical protein [Clostridioides difficile]HBK6675207.1 hypothetical protein [Enterococcus faecium]